MAAKLAKQKCWRFINALNLIKNVSKEIEYIHKSRRTYSGK